MRYFGTCLRHKAGQNPKLPLMKTSTALRSTGIRDRVTAARHRMAAIEAKGPMNPTDALLYKQMEEQVAEWKQELAHKYQIVIA